MSTFYESAERAVRLPLFHRDQRPAESPNSYHRRRRREALPGAAQGCSSGHWGIRNRKGNTGTVLVLVLAEGCSACTGPDRRLAGIALARATEESGTDGEVRLEASSMCT